MPGTDIEVSTNCENVSDDPFEELCSEVNSFDSFHFSLSDGKYKVTRTDGRS